MPITRTPIHDDDGSGTTGTIIDNAWKQEFYNQIDGAVPGGWVDVPFNAANFTAPAGATWTTNQSTYSYTLVTPQMALVFIYLTPLTLTGTPVRLYIKLPWASVLVGYGGLFNYYLGGSGGFTGLALTTMTNGFAQLDLLRDIGGTVFPAVAPYIFGQFLIRLS